VHAVAGRVAIGKHPSGRADWVEGELLDFVDEFVKQGDEMDCISAQLSVCTER
jgi:hypothetical protein